MARAGDLSNFEFIKDVSLRENLDRTFDHILELISLSESTKYNEVLKGSFRKTIIIYTASIIEALLLYILKQKKTEEECAQTKKKFVILKKFYPVEESKHIVLGEYREEKDIVHFDKLNLDQINKYCRKFQLIEESVFQRVDRVRILRNQQHLGGLSRIERGYTKTDLELVFSVAREVKKLAGNV